MKLDSFETWLTIQSNYEIHTAETYARTFHYILLYPKIQVVIKQDCLFVYENDVRIYVWFDEDTPNYCVVDGDVVPKHELPFAYYKAYEEMESLAQAWKNND